MQFIPALIVQGARPFVVSLPPPTCFSWGKTKGYLGNGFLVIPAQGLLIHSFKRMNLLDCII